jgi:hypothetical protein
MKKYLSVIFFLFTVSYSFSQNVRAYIHDESYADASFFEFKTRLEMAVFEKDTAVLFSMLGDTVLETFDWNVEKDEFIEHMGLRGEEYKKSEFWSEMRLLLRFGFAKTDNIETALAQVPKVDGMWFYTAPSYLKYTHWSKAEFYDSILVLAENANVREQPDKNSPVIKKVSFEKLPTAEHPNNDEDMHSASHVFNEEDKSLWVCVQMADGKLGYISHDLTSENIGRQLTIIKINGKWKIVVYYGSYGC